MPPAPKDHWLDKSAGIQHIDAQSRESIEGAVVSLRDYLKGLLEEQRSYFALEIRAARELMESLDAKCELEIGALRQLSDERHRADTIAIGKADASTQMHFTNINNLQAKMDEQNRQFVNRETYEQGHKTVVNDLYEAKARLSSLEGRLYGAAAVAATIPTVVAIMLHFFK